MAKVTITNLDSLVDDVVTNNVNAIAAITAADTATTKADEATTKANEASVSADAANTSRANAESSERTATEVLSQVNAIYDNFDDRYLGGYVSAPLVDNDGAEIQEGALYWNATEGKMYARSSGIWDSPLNVSATPVAEFSIDGSGNLVVDVGYVEDGQVEWSSV